MPDPRFVGLIHSILSSAEAALGERDSPVFNRLASHGAIARRTAERSLGLLSMLEEKSRGNLDETERDTLHRAHRRIRALLDAAPDDTAPGNAPDRGAPGGGVPGDGMAGDAASEDAHRAGGPPSGASRTDEELR